MKKKIGILAAVVTVLFSSCVSYGYVSFERLEAGDVNYPENIRRVGVVNNMPYCDSQGLDLTVQATMEGDGKVVTDTLAYLLASSDYFDTVVVCDSVLQGNNTSLSKPYALSSEQADSLMELLGVDLLFAVDRVKVDLDVVGDRMVNVYSNKSIKSVISPVLFAYIPGRKGPWFAVSDTDKLFYDYYQRLSLGHIQKEASAYAAYMLMEHLLPSWKMVERTYYVANNVELRDANVYMQSGLWRDAYYLWKQLYDREKGKKKMMAAFNLAVYHEANDETEQAVAYVKEALALAKEGSYDAAMMDLYLLQLKERLEKRQKLDMQMQRFE